MNKKNSNKITSKNIKKEIDNFSKLITTLPNGIKIYSSKDVDTFYVSFNNFGTNIDPYIGINGITHLFEHYVFQNYYVDEKLNAFTKADLMSFYTYSNDYNLFKKIIEFFYIENDSHKDDSPKDNSKDSKSKYTELLLDDEYYANSKDFISKLKKELENEYYYRYSQHISSNCYNVVYNRPQYPGGREVDFSNTNDVINGIKKLWKYLDPKDIYFIIPEFHLEKSLNLIRETFGTKKKTFNLKRNNSLVKNIPQKCKDIENPFVYLTSNVYFYEVVIRFDADELKYVKKQIAILNYFTNFLLYIEYSIIENDCIVRFITNYYSVFKLLLYTIKNNTFSNILNLQTGDDLIRIIPYNQMDTSYINDMILYYDEIQEVSKYEPIKIIENVANFFKRLNNKLYKYGDFFIISPNDMLHNKNDVYHNPYSMMCSGLDTFISQNKIYNADYKLFFDNAKYTMINFQKNLYCTKNCIKRDFNDFCVNKKFKLKVPKGITKYPSLNLLDASLIQNNNNDQEMILFSNNYYNLLNVQNSYNKTINGLDYDSSIGYNSLNIDSLHNIFSYYLFNSISIPKISDLISMMQNKIKPVYRNFDNYHISFTCDKIIDIKTPYSFVVLFFKMPEDNSFNLLILSHLLKSHGYIYSGREKTFEFSNYNHNYLFYPTVFINEVINYSYDYIKSFDLNCEIFIIRSKQSDCYDFSNLDNSSMFVKII